MGLAENFKKRQYKHKSSMERKNPDDTTTLSAHFWAELEAGRAPRVTWRVLESRIPQFNPVAGKCQLCIREKLHIVMKPHLATFARDRKYFRIAGTRKAGS